MSSMSQSVPRLAILDDYQPAALRSADWSGIEHRVSIDVYSDTIEDEDLLVQRLADYQIICSMRERTKFSSSLLDRLPNLRLLATTGMRNFAIDMEHAKKKGIVVTGTLAESSNSTLEHIWAIILATVRHIVQEDANIKAGNPQWQTVVPSSLSGKTLGLIGVGKLGSQTAKIAKAFNMNVIGWSPNLTQERATEAGVGFIASKEELLKTSDIVSLHIVLSERTKKIINAADLALLKPTSYIINTSRGPLIDEAALLAVLKSKKIAGGGFDVYDKEPLPSDHPLRGLNNVLLAPHNGYVNDISYQEHWGQMVENISEFLDDKRPRRVIN